MSLGGNHQSLTRPSDLRGQITSDRPRIPVRSGQNKWPGLDSSTPGGRPAPAWIALGANTCVQRSEARSPTPTILPITTTKLMAPEVFEGRSSIETPSPACSSSGVTSRIRLAQRSNCERVRRILVPAGALTVRVREVTRLTLRR
jgi:hypothetical protein